MALFFFDKNVYSLEAIKRASYELPKQSSPQITTTNEKNRVETSIEIDESEFVQSVLDHQLRIEAEKKYGLIRTILVAQAIEPRGDLDSVVNTLKCS